VRYVDHGHGALALVDPTGDAVRATSSAVALIQWWPELLTHSLRVGEQRTNDELVRCERHSLGQVLRELTSGGCCDEERVLV
jgi:hypothetical protein